MPNVDLDAVGQALGLKPCRSCSKCRIKHIFENNRRLKRTIIREIISAFARMNGCLYDNFGLIKVKLEGSEYYFGVVMMGGLFNIVDVKSFPTKDIDWILQEIVVERFKGCIGVMNHGTRTDPIIFDAETKTLKITTWFKEN